MTYGNNNGYEEGGERQFTNRPAYNNGGGYKKPYNNNYQKKEPVDHNAPLPPPKFYKAYAGTGNGPLPSEIVTQIKRLSNELDTLGFTLRTGGMDGAEEEFENSSKNTELHLPWKNFGHKESKFTFSSPEVKSIAKKFHPGYDSLHFTVQAFLAKNVRILLGKDLTSSAMFLLCWSQDGCESIFQRTSSTGNVGHAIAIASTMCIPVFNLGKSDAEQRLKKYLGITNEQISTIEEI